MDKKARARATASTQEHLSIRDIMDDLIINKNGSEMCIRDSTSSNHI